MKNIPLCYFYIGGGILLITLTIITFYFRKKIGKWLIEIWNNQFKLRVYVGGMIPNETNYSILEDWGRDNLITQGTSDENGEINIWLPRKYLGKKLKFPIRRSGFKFDHESDIRIQPWGHFEAIKMLDDSPDPKKTSAVAKQFQNPVYASEKYYEAFAKAIYLARNQVNITTWFLVVVSLTILAGLFASGLNLFWSIVLMAGVWAIRALLKKRILGLHKKPIK